MDQKNNIEETLQLKLFKQECKFLGGDAKLVDKTKVDFSSQGTDTYISTVGSGLQLPEVAFFGRSNVGKSSLINSLLHRKKLVKASNKPGKTKEINFFKLAEKLIIVDLPGYGYASVSTNIKIIWQNIVLKYLKGRSKLTRIYLLVDSRHAIKDSDLEIMHFLNKIPKSYALVLTKIDKISKDMLNKQISDFTQTILKAPAAYPEIFTTSSKQDSSFNPLRLNIASLVTNYASIN